MLGDFPHTINQSINIIQFHDLKKELPETDVVLYFFISFYFQ